MLIAEEVAPVSADALLTRDVPPAGAEERLVLRVVEGRVTAQAALVRAARWCVDVPAERSSKARRQMREPGRGDPP